MATADPRAVLEGIAYGGDASITAGDRVRAIEQLRALDREDDPLDRDFYAELKGIADEELDRMTDAALAAMLLAADDLSLDERFPETRAVLEQRVRERVEQLVDVNQRHREVEARAHEIAEQIAETMYATRSFRAVRGADNAQDAPSTRGATADPPEPARTPTPPPAEALQRQERTFTQGGNGDGRVRTSPEDFKRRVRDERKR